MQCRMCGYEFDEKIIGRSCQGCGKENVRQYIVLIVDMVIHQNMRQSLNLLIL